MYFMLVCSFLMSATCVAMDDNPRALQRQRMVEEQQQEAEQARPHTPVEQRTQPINMAAQLPKEVDKLLDRIQDIAELGFREGTDLAEKFETYFYLNERLSGLRSADGGRKLVGDRCLEDYGNSLHADNYLFLIWKGLIFNYLLSQTEFSRNPDNQQVRAELLRLHRSVAMVHAIHDWMVRNPVIVALFQDEIDNL